MERLAVVASGPNRAADRGAPARPRPAERQPGCCRRTARRLRRARGEDASCARSHARTSRCARAGATSARSAARDHTHLRARRPRVRAAARRPRRPRARERRAVRRARVARGPADHRARHAGRSGHDPGRPRRARLRQRRGRRRARLRRPPSSCWPRRRARSSTPTSPSTRTGRRCGSSSCPARRLLAGETPGAARGPRHQPAHGGGALADRQGDRRCPRAPARRQRDRGRHRGQARRARRSASSPQAGAVLASSLDYEQTLARIAELAVPRLADWCAVTLPDGRPAAHGRRRARRSGQGRASRATTRSATRRRSTRRAGARAGAARGRLAARQRHHRRAARRRRSPTPSSARRSRGLGMRAVMLVPMVAGGRAIGVISFVSAESGRSFSARPTSSWPRSSAGAPAPRSRTRACTASARTSRPRSSAGCCPTRCRAIPGLRLASLYRPAGEENLVGGDFYDAFATAAGLDAAGRRRHRPRRGRRRADRAGAAHAAHRRARCSAIPARRSSSSTTRWPSARELTPCTVALVHVTGADRATCSAPGIRSRC